MTVQTKAQLSANFQSKDPQNWVNDLLDSLGGYQLMPSSQITFASATQNIGSIPANSLIKTVYVIRTTAWDAITTFQVGKTGTAAWLVDTAEANVNGAIPAGEEGTVEIIDVNKVVTTTTTITLTLNQGGAAAGAGYVLIEYARLT